jgi:hypothetical protein
VAATLPTIYPALKTRSPGACQMGSDGKTRKLCVAVKDACTVGAKLEFWAGPIVPGDFDLELDWLFGTLT